MKNEIFISLISVSLKSFAESTRPIYLSELNIFAGYIEPRPLSEATNSDAMTYLNYLHARTIDGQPLAQKTIRRKIDSLISMYDMALDFGGCAENPFVRASKLVRRMKRKPKRATRAIPYSDVIETIRTIENARDRALMSVLFGAGLRVSEALGLCAVNVSEHGRNLGLLVQTSKTNKTRCVMLPIWASKFLRDYLSDLNLECGELLFGISRAWATGLCKRYFGASAHSARYTHISYLLDQGVPIYDIARAVGHEQIQTTMLYDKRRKNYDTSVCVLADFLEIEK